MKQRHTLKVALTLKGPILTKSSSPALFGLDAAVARTATEQEESCLPGSLIKGKIKEALLVLGSTTAEVTTLLGDEGGMDLGHNDIHRGSWLFPDNFLSSTGEEKGCKHRIAVIDVLGSVKGEALQVIETPFPPGKEVEFSGDIRFYGDDTEAEATLKKIRQALRWTTGIGANRSIGFGRLLKAIVELVPEDPQSPQSAFPSEVAALAVSLRPSGPLCVAQHKIGGNLFESEEFIPGNMLAGAVMETAKKLGITIPHFNLIRFRHAFPALVNEGRPPAIPLSLVRKKGESEEERTRDVADHKSSVTFEHEGKKIASAFCLDWKPADWEEVEKNLHIVHPARELRVRTAIDSVKRTGLDGSLFAWEMVHPFTNPGKEALEWKTIIDLGDLPDGADRKATAEVLAKVLRHLGFLSKTKATCTATVDEMPADAPPEMRDGDTIRLVLRTPAQLADPRFQDVSGVPKSGAISAEQMLKLYRDAWAGEQLSGGSLELSHHFARQFLAGGNYLAKRFQKNKPYNPWLLTATGSVFVLTVRDADKASKRLKSWLNTGLPLPGWVDVSNFGRDWQSNPYIPQNGFGEVATHTPSFPTP
jgi:hypothetical protein